MKKHRKIRWSKSGGAKQMNRSFFGTEGSLIGELSLFMLCTLLFFGAACGMVQNVFDWNILTLGSMVRVAVITIFVSVLVELIGKLKPSLARMVRPGTGGVGILGFAVYLWRSEQGEAMQTGFYAVATSFLSRWNNYYNTSYRCAGGDPDEVLTALRFGITMLCFLLVWWARARKRSWIPVLFPLVVLVAELLIGWAPEGLSMLVMAAGLCLSGTAGFRQPEFLPAPDKQGGSGNGLRRQLVWLPTGVILLLLCIGIKLAGTPFAEDAVLNGKSRLRQKNKEVMQTISDWTGWQEVNVAKSVEQAIKKFLKKNEIETKSRPESNTAYLDNSKPEYDEVTVLKVALDKEPSFGAYLIGFYADEYKDGVWSTDVDAFEEACKKAGHDPETVSAGIVSLANSRLAEHYGKESLSELSYWGIRGWMYYAKGNLVSTYLPYFSESSSEGVSTEGDGRYIKEKNITKFPFVLWNYDVDELVGVLFRGEELKKSWEKKEWERWYETYAEETYLDVPNWMKQVKKVAEEIRTSGRTFFQIEGQESKNFDRLNKAYQVADWMRQNTSYSLELPELPKGCDPVEFFLGTSKQGYCMHYASASVMILRELGVPARYVSGYVAGSFLRDELTTKYQAVVLDSAAHAWVEIYLEGIGWIPVEVTVEYSVLPAGTSIYRQNETGNYQVVHENWPDVAPPGHGYWSTVVPFVTPKPTPTPIPTSTPSVTEGGEVPTPGQEENGVSQAGGAEQPGEGKPTQAVKPQKQNQSKEEASERFEVNPVVVLFLLLGILTLFWLLMPLYRVYLNVSCKVEERRLYRKTKYRGNRQRIRVWNRMLYRKLRAKGKIRKRDVRDEDYGTVLQKYKEVLLPEELERYMCLVKAAAFSYNEFTDEDAEFCKIVYRKVLYESKKKESDRETGRKDMR